jgi:hypothetical protein
VEDGLGHCVPMADDVAEQELTRATGWDRRVVAAFEVVYAARRGVLILRIAAALIAVIAVVGSALFHFSDNSVYVSFNDAGITRQVVGQFMQDIAVPLASAAVVLALAYLVEIAAARLDVDIVVADEDQVLDSSDD